MPRVGNRVVVSQVVLSAECSLARTRVSQCSLRLPGPSGKAPGRHGSPRHAARRRAVPGARCRQVVVRPAVTMPTSDQGEGRSVHQGQRRTLDQDRGPGLGDRRRVGHSQICDSGRLARAMPVGAPTDGGRGVLPWSPRRMGRSPGVDHARHDTRRAMGDLQAGEPCPALGETRALTGTRRGPALWHRYQQNASRCQPGCSSSVDQRPTAPPIRPTADNRLKVLCRNAIGQSVVGWADTLMAYPLGQQLQ